MGAKIVRFSDYEAAPKPRLPSDESALVIILPVIRIDRFTDAALARGLATAIETMKPRQRRRLARHMKDIEDV